MTVLHLRDLVSNRRKIIKCEDVKIYQAPQYQGLKVEDMLLWAQAYPEVAQYLPEEPREVEKLHRDYVSTVIYTVVGSRFSDWVESKIKARNEELEAKQDMTVHLDPDIAEILKNSTSVSCQKGISNNLFKVSAFKDIYEFEFKHFR